MAVRRKFFITNVQATGGGGTADVLVETVTANTFLLAYKAIKLNASGLGELASNTNVAHADRLLGVTVTEGAQVDVVIYGPVQNPAWSWTPDSLIFLGANGELTADPLTGSFSQLVGFAESPTTVFFRPQRSIVRA